MIVDVLVEAFADLMEADADAFRTKFRKMAADPFAFYRGSAVLFYADMATTEDRWSDERTSRVWIHGDLHAENFGTYMDATGRIVFDVNDFDEAYLGHVSWDLRRFAASFALLAWRKAFSDEVIGELITVYLDAWLDQVEAFTRSDADREFALVIGNTEGAVHELIRATAGRTRLGAARPDDGRRGRRAALRGQQAQPAAGGRRARRGARRAGEVQGHAAAPPVAAGGRLRREGPHRHRRVRHRQRRAARLQRAAGGLRPGAGERRRAVGEAGRRPGARQIVDDPEIRGYFEHEGHRTAVSRRALQSHASQFLGYTVIRGTGFVVAELSPYELDLDWEDLTEPDDIRPVLEQLGRATAKLHCVGDADSDHTLVPFQTEEAITTMLAGRRDEFVADLVEFAHAYARRTQEDHRHFVDAFRAGAIPGISSSGELPTDR